MAVLLILNHGFSKPLMNKYISSFLSIRWKNQDQIIREASNVHSSRSSLFNVGGPIWGAITQSRVIHQYLTQSVCFWLQ